MPFTLGGGDTHVWLVSADVDDHLLQRLLRIIDDEERRRALAFHFDRDRRLSIVGRAALRFLAGQYLSRDPAKIRFTYGPFGKPLLDTQELHVNMSHCGGYVAIAVSVDAVGVDLEVIRPVPELMNISDRYFADREAQTVRNAPAGERLSSFFGIWTAKEAVVKGVGGGLSIGLQSFVTWPCEGRITAVENVGQDPELNGWSVYALPRYELPRAGEEPLHVAVALRHSVVPAVRELDAAAMI